MVIQSHFTPSRMIGLKSSLRIEYSCHVALYRQTECTIRTCTLQICRKRTTTEFQFCDSFVVTDSRNGDPGASK
jgi:hypothetical protein